MEGRVALVRPLARGGQQEFQEPLGAEALAGYLRQLGWACRVFDRQLDRRLGRDTLAALRDYGPKWVGFSLMTEAEAPDALQPWQSLKQPGRRCFAGGLFITTAWEQARALFPQDATLICGEGEGAVAALLCGQPLPKAPLPPDDWAKPSRDQLELYLRLGGVINLRSARGCPGRCAFCATPGLHIPCYAARSLRLVVDEMEELASFYQAAFNFVDDDFGPLERLEALAAELERRKLKTAFSLELRAGELRRATRKQLRRLRQAGLSRVFTGLENLDLETLKRWCKPIDTQALLQAVARCRGAGIETSVGYILWHERSTPEAVQEQMARLHEQGLLDPKAALSRLILFPGSRLYRELGNYGPPRPVDLLPRAAAAYQELEQRLSPLLKLWIKAAAQLPAACCRELLQGSGEAEQLRALLKAVNEQCAQAVFDRREPDLTLIAGGFDALCAAHH